MTVLAVAAQSFELHLVGGLWLGNPWDYLSLWTLVAIELVAVHYWTSGVTGKGAGCSVLAGRAKPQILRLNSLFGLLNC